MAQETLYYYVEETVVNLSLMFVVNDQIINLFGYTRNVEYILFSETTTTWLKKKKRRKISNSSLGECS